MRLRVKDKAKGIQITVLKCLTRLMKQKNAIENGPTIQQSASIIYGRGSDEDQTMSGLLKMQLSYFQCHRASEDVRIRVSWLMVQRW